MRSRHSGGPETGSTGSLPPGVDALLTSGYRYAISLTHDPSAAEDLLQDACVAILAAGGPWERPYLFTTVRNRFIDRCRRQRTVRFLPLEGGGGAEELQPEADWEAPDVLANGRLEQALAALRPEEREALFLAVVEGYTAEEIAGLTERPRGTILSLMHRAKAKLRSLLRADQEAQR